jgi:DNA-binding protein HU-beta
MIRRTLRLGIRLGLLAGIGLALFKLIQGRRSTSELGSPSPDWAPAPAPVVNPNLPRTPPEPELVKPVMLEEIVEKKAAPAPPPEVTIEPPVVPTVASLTAEPVVKKASPARKAPAKKVAATPEPAAAGPVKKVVPKKAAAKKAAPPVEAPPVAAKAAPVKKAPKKQG